MVKVHHLAELRELYPEFQQLRFDDLIKGINKGILKRIATFLIGQKLYLGEAVDNKNLIENWFTECNGEFAEDLLNRINKHEQTRHCTIEVVYIISMLQILQAGLNFEDEGLMNAKSDEQSEIDLFLAMLLANQTRDDHFKKDADKIVEMFPDIAAEVGTMYHSFPTNDIMNFDLRSYGFSQIIKAMLLFVFLESTEQGRSLLSRMYKYFEIEHWRDYLYQIAPLLAAWTGRDQASSVDIVFDENAGHDQSLNFIKKLALNRYAQLEDMDYIQLRERPFLELNSYTFRIIHPIFLIDKAYKGLFFLLKKLNEIKPKEVKSDFRGWYTTEFSEGECFKHLVEYCMPSPDFRAYDKDLRQARVIGPPDCYVRTGNNVFLFESKDILISANVKRGYDFECLLNELKKKLLVEGNGRPVGIGQLINNIRKLLTRKDTYDANFSADRMVIYPIIVTHDAMFDAPGLNKLLQSFFSDELAKLGLEGIDISRIKPLVIMNIDYLIIAGHLFHFGRLRFEALLEAFYENCRWPKTLSISMEDQMQEFNNSNLSFHGYFPYFLGAKFDNRWESLVLVRHFFEKFEIDGRELFFNNGE